MDAGALRDLFTKPYGAPAPSQEAWRAAYATDVHFQDPTQGLLKNEMLSRIRIY
jgi:hypothetical protein